MSHENYLTDANLYFAICISDWGDETSIQLFDAYKITDSEWAEISESNPYSESTSNMTWTVVHVAYAPASGPAPATLTIKWSTGIDYSGPLNQQFSGVTGWSPEVNLPAPSGMGVQTAGAVLMQDSEGTTGMKFQATTADIVLPHGETEGSINNFGSISIDPEDGEIWSAGFAVALHPSNGWNFFPVTSVTEDNEAPGPLQPLKGIEIGSMPSDR